jgi:hypothetical protein
MAENSKIEWCHQALIGSVRKDGSGGERAMTDWQTYRNGNPRAIWNLERLARHRAAKLGYRVHRSRRRKSRDNAGEFMLIHKASSTVLLGAGYTANLEMILEFMEREWMH